MAKWHEGAAWTRHLEVYDRLAKEFYGDARIVDAESRFGTTRAYVFGDSTKSPVFLMHGSYDFAMLWEWLVPVLAKTHQVVAIDRFGDMGRSKPRDGLFSSFPKGEEETVEWLQSVKSELGFGDRPVSFIGHSYGSFVSTVFAKSMPDEVDKLILTGPAAVFAPQSLPDPVFWTVKGLVNAIRRVIPTDRLRSRYMSQVFGATLPEGMSVDDGPFADLYQTMAHLPQGFHIIAGVPHAWSVEELKDMGNRNSTVLLIGGKETFTSAKVMAANAKSAGIPAKVYPEGTHALWFGNEEEMTADILAFLAGEKIEGATYP